MSAVVAHTAAEPDGELTVADRFLDVLRQERDAARQADVDGLTEIQESKRQLLPELRAAHLPDSVRVHIQDLAQRNVMLMRQLVQCYSGLMVANGEPTYDAQGQCNRPESRSLRGCL